MDKRAYIHPKEMDFIAYALRSNNEFDKEQLDYLKSKVKERFNYLNPLILELIEKDIDLKTISKSLDKEYGDLIFLVNKINEEEGFVSGYTDEQKRNIKRLLSRYRK